ncbi:MAG: S-adenosylmethionine:tRNA ribosyltransferase-isomerase [Bacteroidia bacterium]|nr:S-adenosylmethionine:tRNA ribosyltransferase-isomerase [Bacteroidia bacterium]
MSATPDFLTDVRLSDYAYDLPPEQIAEAPLAVRDQARMLVFRKGTISHRVFHDIPTELPPDTLLVGNDTKVIHARLYFWRESGAKIEILLLLPQAPAAVDASMAATGTCTWRCIIGNKKKWKPDETLSLTSTAAGHPLHLTAHLTDREEQVVRFTWTPADMSFAAVVEVLGKLPLPPYISREAAPEDEIRYQTVYARQAGAVAAPTAGLHMTEAVLTRLRETGTRQLWVTLHVSAGTFLPVKHDQVVAHDMHAEQMVVTRDALVSLLDHIGPVIPIGTTSLRWLESLYWLGVSLCQGYHPDADTPFCVAKLLPYEATADALPDRRKALQAVRTYMDTHQKEQITGETRILIMPGYTFRMVTGLITNFHMPETTLILLVAALLGPAWRQVYEEALREGYRFLSYGDSSLLLP